MPGRSGDWWLVTSHSQLLIPNPFLQTFSGGFAAEKGSQPRLATRADPFQGKGLAWILPPSCGRRCPEGAEVGWRKRYERERGDRLKYAVYESTRAPPQKKANPASLRSTTPSKGRGSRGYSLLPMEGGAPKGRRLDGKSGISVLQPSPRGEGGERSEPDRVLAA